MMWRWSGRVVFNSRLLRRGGRGHRGSGDSHQTAFLRHRSADLKPTAGIDPRFDGEVEPAAARAEIGTPDGCVCRPQNEIVPTLAGRARLVAEEVAAAKFTDDRHVLAFETPWLQRERSHRRRRGELRFRDARDAYDKLLTGTRPTLRIWCTGVRAYAWITGLESPDVEKLAAHFDEAARALCVVEDERNVTLAASQDERRATFHELSVEQDVLQVKVARKLMDRRHRRGAADRRLSACATGRSKDQRNGRKRAVFHPFYSTLRIPMRATISPRATNSAVLAN